MKSLQLSPFERKLRETVQSRGRKAKTAMVRQQGRLRA